LERRARQEFRLAGERSLDVRGEFINFFQYAPSSHKPECNGPCDIRKNPPHCQQGRQVQFIAEAEFLIGRCQPGD